MEDHGLAGVKSGPKGKAAKETRDGTPGGAVDDGGAARRKEGKNGGDGVDDGGVLRRKEGKRGGEGEGLKAGKEKKSSKKEKQTTRADSTGKEEERKGKEGAGHPPTGGGEETGLPTRAGTELTKRLRKKESTTESKMAEGEKRDGGSAPAGREHIGEQLLTIVAKPHTKMLMDFNLGEPWSVQVRGVWGGGGGGGGEGVSSPSCGCGHPAHIAGCVQWTGISGEPRSDWPFVQGRGGTDGSRSACL